MVNDSVGGPERSGSLGTIGPIPSNQEQPAATVVVANVSADRSSVAPGQRFSPSRSTIPSPPQARQSRCTRACAGPRLGPSATHPVGNRWPRCRRNSAPAALEPGTGNSLGVTRQFSPGSHLITLRFDPDTRTSAGATTVCDRCRIRDSRADYRWGSSARDRAIRKASFYVQRSLRNRARTHVRRTTSGMTDFTPRALFAKTYPLRHRSVGVILSDVKALSPEQVTAIEEFVQMVAACSSHR